uniref:Uncharacterized protein n=1 Tax=Enterococcus phage Sw5 TaxID=2950724 RepID=A0A9E7MHW1_9CAUD|nr:hypothetical protein Sw5_10 [Enterococcus phage Sw5]
MILQILGERKYDCKDSTEEPIVKPFIELIDGVQFLLEQENVFSLLNSKHEEITRVPNSPYEYRTEKEGYKTFVNSVYVLNDEGKTLRRLFERGL